jgi:signal transduction histidine kinase
MSSLRSLLLRYGAALAVTAATTGVMLCLKPFLEKGLMVMYIPGVMLSAWYGGLGPGLLATILSVGTTAFLFLDPAGTFFIQSADDLTELVVFSFVALLTSVLNTAQKRAQQALVANQEKVRLVYDVTRAANEAETVGQAFRFALRRLCEGGVWIYAHVYLLEGLPPERFVPSVFYHAAEDARFAALREGTMNRPFPRSALIAGRVVESGRVEWVEDLAADRSAPAYEPFLKAGVSTAAAFPVKVGRDTVGVFECFALDPIPQRETLTDLLEAIGLELGQVVERRRLQEGYSEAVWQQQRVIAQELHDGLGQQLTGLGFISQSLTEKLRNTDEAKSAAKVTEGLKQALEQIRGLSKGVFPVAPEPEGLRTALRQLAESTGAACSVVCQFECPGEVSVENNQVALHLYRIAQEAVTNAVKHGRPSRIMILLESAPEGLRLVVTDDGKGIASKNGSPSGSGLRIMRYRAAAIGATLRLDDAPGGGTRVMCLLGDSERGSG